jgi:hypothetical protein
VMLAPSVSPPVGVTRTRPMRSGYGSLNPSNGP